MVRYQVAVVDGHGEFVCGATLNCPDDAMAQRRFDELPLPPGDAVLKAGRRVLARRSTGPLALQRTGS